MAPGALQTVRSASESHRSNRTLLIDSDSLYRGLQPVLWSLAASGFVFFYSFHGLRTAFSNDQHSPLKDLLFGSIAGVINIMVTAPLWVVNTSE